MINRILHLSSCIIEIYLTCCEKEIKCSLNIAFYLFSSACLINSIKYEHSCKTIYAFNQLKFKYPRSTEISCNAFGSRKSPPVYMWLDGRLNVYKSKNEDLVDTAKTVRFISYNFDNEIDKTIIYDLLSGDTKL